MFPHPILATEDDAIYVTKVVLRLPELMMRLFDALDAVYTRGDGDSSVLATSLYFTIFQYLEILATLPEDVFQNKDDPANGPDKELWRMLCSLYNLFKTNLRIGPNALRWKLTLTGLASECADHMRHAKVKLPKRNYFYRQVICPEKPLYALLLVLYVLSIFLVVLLLIVLPITRPPKMVAIGVSIPGVLTLLFSTSAMGFYFVKVSFGLERLHHQNFQARLMHESGGELNYGGEMSALGLQDGLQTLNRSGKAGGTVSANVSALPWNGTRMINIVQANGITTELAENGLLSSTPRISIPPVSSPVAGVSTTSGAASSGLEKAIPPQTKTGYYAILYGNTVGYIDGRQLDAQVIMIAYNRNYIITRWNNAAEVLTGFLEDGCVGKNLTDLVQSPTNRTIIEEIEHSRKGKPIKVKLRSLATPPSVLHTIISPILNPEQETIGHILICANSTDNLRLYRNYYYHYVWLHASEALKRISELHTLCTDDFSRIVSLRNFIRNCIPSHIESLARDMTTEWEWTNVDQFLSRTFGDSLPQHTRVNNPSLPPTICISPLVSKALSKTVSTLGPSMLNFHVESLSGVVYLFSVSIAAKNHLAKVDYEQYRKIEESVSDVLHDSGGSISRVDERIILRFPCQIAPIGDSLDEDESEKVHLPQRPSVVNCSVNVVTMINSIVDQYDLSLSLLKTMFVSLASVRDRGDLEQRLTAQPCDVDVVIFDLEFYSSCKDLLMSFDHGAIVIPFVTSSNASMNTSAFTRVIHAPVQRRVVQELMLEVGREVSERKNAASAREERQRILTLRQDSPWTKGKLLGRGSQGAVYEATSDLTGGKMAVKIFHFAANSEGSINRLLNEVKIMCSLNHPNIVHYFHSERTGKGVNLFMELCDGSLTDVINGRLQKPDHLNVLEIIRQVLNALTYLHSRGIAHRDVKPQNILLKGDTIKLTDFGTAREGSATKEVAGTLRYMAPEVYRGQNHSLPCDLWSIGCLVCELLGSPPAFMNEGVLLADISSAKTYLNNLPDNSLLHDFLDKCFRIEPTQRGTSRELLNHQLLKLDTPNSDVEAHSVFNAPAKEEADPGFSINSL